MNQSFRRLILGLLLAAPLLWSAASQAEDDHAGTEACAACHEEVAELFEATAHSMTPNWDREKGCESCHGPGVEHIDSGGDMDKIVRFADLSPKEASEQCLTCHQRQEKHFSFIRSIHRLGDVGCNDCHNPHSTADKLLIAPGAELCSKCHQAIAAQFDLPRSHPITECAKCHEPHATKAIRTSKTLYDQTCGSCHFEKTSPFLYSHDVLLVDGCSACHEVHGSPNRHLLKHEPQVNLCYQCHSASVTPGWHSTPRFLNEKCTACHTAIHGSNTSPFFLEE